MTRLLVTNCTNDPAAGGVYLYDTRLRKARRVHDQPCRGITHGPDGLYFVTNDGVICQMEPHTWKAERRLETGLRGSHDLRWIDDHFHLVASHGNQVVRFDCDLKEVDRFQVVKDDGDVCHANCLIKRGDDLLLTIFTLSALRREEKRHSPAWWGEGKVLRLNWAQGTYDILHEPLGQPHSLTVHDGKLFCVESYTSAITRVGPAKDEKHVVRRLHGFVRGMAFTPRSVWVGISRRTRNVNPVLHFFERMYLRCGIMELDPVNFKIKGQLKLPGTEVYEILPLDPVDGT